MSDKNDLSRRVLILTPTGADAEVAASLLAEAGFESAVCASIVELCERLAQGAGMVLIAEEGLDTPEVDLLTTALQDQPPWSDVPLVVLTTADDSAVSTGALEARFASAGSMTLLERPFRVATFLSAIRVAMRARQKQYEIRRLIEQAARAAHELAQSQERLGLAIETSQIGMWTLSFPTYELDASWRCREIFGRADDRPFGYRDLFDAVHPDDRARMRTAVAGALAGGGGEYELEYRVLRNDGSIGWVAVRGRAVVRADGSPSFMTGTSLDITERKLAESTREQLLEAERAARGAAERASRLKDEFLATLSHELRTPLTAVLGWAQVLKRLGTHGAEERSRAIDAIERNAIAQKRLIEDLLDMSSIAAGTFELEREPVEVDAVVDAALASARRLAEEKSVILERSGTAGERVLGDRRRLEQLVWNLLSNAIKFSSRGAAVRLHVDASPETVRVVVRDTGAGIAPDFLPHVFERFRQQDSSTKRAHGGLGLGLGMVKHLVQMQGGRVRAESEGSGQGATFTVWLPVWRHDARGGGPSAVPAEERAPARLAGLHIVVVDDDDDARLLVGRWLEEQMARVTLAGSAAEGLEAVVRERPSLLVSDIGMPHENGYDLIRRVRELPDRELATTPAIALTAFARLEDRDRALRAGYESHLSKPIDLAALLEACSELARRPPPPKPPPVRAAPAAATHGLRRRRSDMALDEPRSR